ncbi:hypothetical protein [Rhodoferax saidenbachensis]|uniref:Uncharacterized protein n=1 Tax=Rhodoferax saidenbachensis TaxID=1484693 RepID=A0A1P8K5B5_9BURK|nr:hypothetical protein [Rhodoferax saidenbachensis]APW41189.1 hypothetical protein RS694_00595 [Rhodoferax saidenbachensis]
MTAFVLSAMEVLTANEAVRFGIFGVVGASKVFPPHGFLNEFFAAGNDPCDQDNLMGAWRPFSVSHQEYLEIKDWWVAAHPGVVEDDLGAANWDDWVQEVLNP